MTLEVKNHSDPPAGPTSWVFYRPEWVSIEKKNFFKTINITTEQIKTELIKTQQMLIK